MRTREGSLLGWVVTGTPVTRSASDALNASADRTQRWPLYRLLVAMTGSNWTSQSSTRFVSRPGVFQGAVPECRFGVVLHPLRLGHLGVTGAAFRQRTSFCRALTASANSSLFSARAN
jgi:hypothetical protein